MGFNLLINGVYWGYISHLLTFYKLPGTSKHMLGNQSFFSKWNGYSGVPKNMLWSWFSSQFRTCPKGIKSNG